MGHCVGCHQLLDNHDGDGHLYKNGRGPYCKECYVQDKGRRHCMICKYCHGHGYVEREAKDGTTGEIRCPYCGGYGEVQMKDGLKPCPWCNVVPHLIMDADRRFDIACVNPQCPIRPELNRYYPSKREAIEAWNFRSENRIR